MEIEFKSGELEDIDDWKKSGNKIIQNFSSCTLPKNVVSLF